MKKKDEIKERKNSKTLIASIVVAFFIIAFLAFFYSNTSLTGKVVEEPLNLTELSRDSPVPSEEYELNQSDIPKSDYQIKIVNFAYSPSHLEIRRGETVSWENRDSVFHTIKSTSEESLNSGYLEKGDYYYYTFTEPGTYDYYCEPHPYMQGVIVVK